MSRRALTGGDLLVSGCDPNHLGALLQKLEECGVQVRTNGDSVRVVSNGPLQAADVVTEEYPGFPTDMQAQFVALATQADGVSIVTENIFENRFMHAQELVRMGANIKVEGTRAVVRGKTPLSGAAVQASDLRASASLVLAALVAEDETIIDRVYHIDRGYERIEEKLRGVGAQIRRIGEFLPKRVATRCGRGMRTGLLRWLTISRPFQKLLQVGKEAGIGNRDTFRVADKALSLRPECGDSERHGDAMVAERFDLRAV